MLDMDDDEFDYDDDYSFNDSDGEEEDVRREFELDDIRSDISQNPEDAAVRLRTIAKNHTSLHSIAAAHELFKLKMDRDTFMTLVEAVAHAPQDIDSYTRTTPLESSWALLEQKLQPNMDTHDELVDVFVKAVSVLKGSTQPRAYFKSLLCLVNTHLSLKRFDDALSTLQSQFYSEIKDFANNKLWVPPLTFDAKVLEMEICLCEDPVEIRWLSNCLKEVSENSGGVTLPVKTCLVNEAQARFYLALSSLDDAKHFLEKTVRGYEEIQGSNGSQHLLVRSLVILILVSTILGEGTYNPLVEVPIVNSMLRYDVVVYALDVATGFASQKAVSHASQLYESLHHIEQWLLQDSWKLGSDVLMKTVIISFVRIQTIQALGTYQRIRWNDLVNQVKESPFSDKVRFSHSLVSKFILEDSLKGQFRLNMIDETVDRVRFDSEWRRPVAELAGAQTMPLPQRYQDFQKMQLRKKEELAILNKWKPTAHSNCASRSRMSRSAESETYELLKRTLEKHREAMIK